MKLSDFERYVRSHEFEFTATVHVAHPGSLPNTPERNRITLMWRELGRNFCGYGDTIDEAFRDGIERHARDSRESAERDARACDAIAAFVTKEPK